MCIRDRIYTCICPLNPHRKIEHILVPELKLGLVTANSFLPLEKALTPYRVIHFTRFTDMEVLKKKKQRMRFNQRMAAELLDESVPVSYTHLSGSKVTIMAEMTEPLMLPIPPKTTITRISMELL